MSNWHNELKTALLAYEEAKASGRGAAQEKIRMTNILFNARKEIVELAGRAPLLQSTTERAKVDAAPVAGEPDHTK